MQDLLKTIDKLKAEIDGIKPLKASELKQLKDYYKIGLTYSSNAVEGNSIDETETKIIIENGLTIGGKPLREHFEVIGHGDAYEYIHTLLNEKIIKESFIKRIHYLFYRHIDEKNAGKYRKDRVYITGSEHMPPAPQNISRCMKEYVLELQDIKAGHHPVVYAAIAHRNFVAIHPFIDGNGRVARLLMNLILMQAGYQIAIIPPILRRQYIQALEKSHVKKDNTEFIKFIAECVKQTQKDYLRMLS